MRKFTLALGLTTCLINGNLAYAAGGMVRYEEAPERRGIQPRNLAGSFSQKLGDLLPILDKSLRPAPLVRDKLKDLLLVLDPAKLTLPSSPPPPMPVLMPPPAVHASKLAPKDLLSVLRQSPTYSLKDLIGIMSKQLSSHAGQSSSLSKSASSSTFVRTGRSEPTADRGPLDQSSALSESESSSPVLEIVYSFPTSERGPSVTYSMKKSSEIMSKKLNSQSLDQSSDFSKFGSSEVVARADFNLTGDTRQPVILGSLASGREATSLRERMPTQGMALRGPQAQLQTVNHVPNSTRATHAVHNVGAAESSTPDSRADLNVIGNARPSVVPASPAPGRRAIPRTPSQRGASLPQHAPGLAQVGVAPGYLPAESQLDGAFVVQSIQTTPNGIRILLSPSRTRNTSQSRRESSRLRPSVRRGLGFGLQEVGNDTQDQSTQRPPFSVTAAPGPEPLTDVNRVLTFDSPDEEDTVPHHSTTQAHRETSQQGGLADSNRTAAAQTPLRSGGNAQANSLSPAVLTDPSLLSSASDSSGSDDGEADYAQFMMELQEITGSLALGREDRGFVLPRTLLSPIEDEGENVGYQAFGGSETSLSESSRLLPAEVLASLACLPSTPRLPAAPATPLASAAGSGAAQTPGAPAPSHTHSAVLPLTGPRNGQSGSSHSLAQTVMLDRAAAILQCVLSPLKAHSRLASAQNAGPIAPPSSPAPAAAPAPTVVLGQAPGAAAAAPSAVLRTPEPPRAGTSPSAIIKIGQRYIDFVNQQYPGAIPNTGIERSLEENIRRALDILREIRDNPLMTPRAK